MDKELYIHVVRPHNSERKKKRNIKSFDFILLHTIVHALFTRLMTFHISYTNKFILPFQGQKRPMAGLTSPSRWWRAPTCPWTRETTPPSCAKSSRRGWVIKMPFLNWHGIYGTGMGWVIGMRMPATNELGHVSTDYNRHDCNSQKRLRRDHELWVRRGFDCSPIGEDSQDRDKTLGCHCGNRVHAIIMWHCDIVTVKKKGRGDHR